MDELQSLKEILYDLGIPVLHRKTEDSPRYTTYHFDLPRITDLEGLERKTKFISAYTHKDVQYVKSEDCHFALRIPKETNEKVKLFDKKYKKILKPSKNLNIFMGIDDNGNPVVVNLKEIPHILIAGTTGSGKSVMVNSLICGLLKQKASVEYYLVDTKRVELSAYKDCIDYIATTPQSAIELLDNICNEMECRYIIMQTNKTKEKPDSLKEIVVVIEELGDLMLQSKSVVENYIVRIAQLGRAAGIHLVIATQHPVVSTLTGNIKANIGCRLALQTTSYTDSICILGHKGAEHLKGSGDALLKLPTQAEEIHLQCPYISDEEITKTVEEYNEQD